MSSFKTIYQEFIYKRTYSRWLEREGRREEWIETVNRYADFFHKRVPQPLLGEFFGAIDKIVNLDVLPSMRCLWSAGEALESDNIAGYNCAYTVVDAKKTFAEILYILMNGTGVGFSVERQYINKLPEVPHSFGRLDMSPWVIGDSKIGWAEAFEHHINMLYNGMLCPFDYSQIRPKGSRLKTFGGRASGHEPLKQLIEYTTKIFQAAAGRKLNSIECYDIVCMIANCVVVGGVRRSATISLSNLSDLRMRHAKDGEFYILNPQRQLSNNSVAYTEKPEVATFMEEWLSLMKSGSGERGIVNREGLREHARLNGRDPEYDFGVNPCGEIILRPKQFCNLTEVVIKPDETLLDLSHKVRAAVILGCLQATLDNFKFLSEEWTKNTKEERLLGVSLTGIHDSAYFSGSVVSMARYLKTLKLEAQVTARRWADALGIAVPKAITCVKPSGTVSQLVNSSSGLHPRYAKHYIRRVRVNATDPVAKLLIAEGVPYEPEVGQELETASTLVFSFPIKSPTGSTTKSQVTALQQLDFWKILKIHWCDHNPSATIYVKPHEWIEVGAWVYKNWEHIGGLSFLPDDGGVYQLAPYEEISTEKYAELMWNFPKLDFSKLSEYEKADQTEGSKEYACQGGVCEL